MKFEILPIDGGYTAELNTTELSNIYKVTGVGMTIAMAIDDALLEYAKFKTKMAKLL